MSEVRVVHRWKGWSAIRPDAGRADWWTLSPEGRASNSEAIDAVLPELARLAERNRELEKAVAGSARVFGRIDQLAQGQGEPGDSPIRAACVAAMNRRFGQESLEDALQRAYDQGVEDAALEGWAEFEEVNDA